MEFNLPSADTLISWGIKGGWSILDQAVYSGANFVVSILLARWFSAEIYGGYSVAFSIFLLLSNMQVALIAEPMSIFGAGKYRTRQNGYLNHLLRLQWIGAFISCVAILPICLLPQNSGLRSSLIAMIAALPFILGYWYMRRAYYLEARSDLALISSAVYAITLLLAVYFFERIGILSVPLSFLAMALASVIASMTTIKPLGIGYLGNYAETTLQKRDVLFEIWDFGKWILLAYVASWLTTMVYPPLLGVLLGLEEAGAFRAVQVLFLPLQQMLASVTLLILPWLSKQHAIRGEERMVRFTLVMVGAVFVAALLYCIAITYFGADLILWMYRRTFYSSYSYLVIYLAIASLIGVIPLVLGLALRVLNRPKAILWSKGIAAIFVVASAFPVIQYYQFQGVVFSLLAGALVDAVILISIFLAVWRKTAQKTNSDMFAA
jgi:O-antigen/teichoic acid export membrane protein